MVLSESYSSLLKKLIFNPRLTDVLIKIYEKKEISLEELDNYLKDPDFLRESLVFLDSNKFITRSGNTIYYKPLVDYVNINNFVDNYKIAKELFYDEVISTNKTRAFNIAILEEKLNEVFASVNKYTQISSNFRAIYKIKDLYPKAADIAIQIIGVNSLEVYDVKDNLIKNSFYKYTSSENFIQSDFEKKTINECSQIKEPIIVNEPQTNSLTVKKIFAVYPVIENNKLVNILLFGFDTANVSMIKDNIIDLINGFVLNFTLTLRTVNMIKVLEDKVAERTNELNKANKDLKSINEEISSKNRAKIKEIEIAANIQRTVIPDPRYIPKIGPLSLGAVWIPMPMKKTGEKDIVVKEVSGDFFNYYKINNDEYGFVIADASGHGIPAALLTMMASAALSFNSRKGGTTAEICERSNREIHKAIGTIGSYLTVFYLKINLKTLKTQFTNAGHHKAIVYRKKTGKLEDWNSEGFFIGAVEDSLYGYGESYLEPGDKVVLTTDGIEEARRLLPEEVDENKFISRILEKVGQEDKDFLLKIYDNKNGKYVINKRELSIEEADRLIEICNAIGYNVHEEGDKTRADFFAEERLKNFIINNAHLHAKDFAEKLIQEVEIFGNGEPADDDRTILVIDVGSTVTNSKNVLIEDAITKISSKNFKEAETILLKYIKEYGEEPDVMLDLAEVYIMSNQDSKAEAIYKEMLKKYPNDYRIYQGLSKVELNRHNYEKAAEYKEESLKIMTRMKKKKK